MSDNVSDNSSDNSSNGLTAVEHIKANSNYLRGTIVESLADRATGGLAEDDTQLSKFHGFYQQDDRDQRSDRARRKLEPALSFMIRVRVPGGTTSPEQWLTMDAIAGEFANETIRLTTRQAFQFHGVLKNDLKPTIRRINESLLDTIAACGDVNRNVMCSPLADASAVHQAASDTAAAISARLTPATGAYREIWLDGEKLAGGPETAPETEETEPVYGKTYLPRKFKIAVAIPPLNDVDAFAQDLAFIAIESGGKLAGFNVAVGGGMGMSHGEPETYPRVADVIGFCTVDQAVDVAEQVVRVQRDFGDRSNRKHARLKYTIDDRGEGGLDWFRGELHDRLGFRLQDERPFRFVRRGDAIGWQRNSNGDWTLTLFIPEGRIRNAGDTGEHRLRSGLRELASRYVREFRLTPNQNLIAAGITDADRPALEDLLARHGIDRLQHVSAMRQQAVACVALPTCGLAMAEAERYLPELGARIDDLLQRHDLADEPVSVRVSGCPNGCSRPYLAEVALVGKAPGRYNLHLGGDALGRRLNRLVGESLAEEQILATLDAELARFAAERQPGEPFGDFVHRVGPDRVAAS